MTEEIKSEQTEERQFSPVEQKAMEQGWRPKEDFSGDPETFIDAPEFVRRGELFDKIEHQSKELKQVKAALDALKQHHSKVREVEYDRALKALQSARKQALVDGETERFLDLEQRIEEVKEEKATFDAELKSVDTQQSGTANPEFISWMEKNPWYTKDEAMQAYADKLGSKLAAQGHTPSRVLTMVEQEIKKEFAHKFQNQKATRPQAVESSSRGGAKPDSFVMSEDERSIMRKLVRAGAMSEQEYIAELKKTR